MRRERDGVDDLSVDSFVRVESIVEGSGYYSVKVANGRTFDIVFPERLPLFAQREIKPKVIEAVRTDLEDRANWNFLWSGQAKGHKFSLAFIVMNWTEILGGMGLLTNRENCFCFPEVRLGNRSNQTPDVVGYGGNGNIFNVEIGTCGKQGTVKAQVCNLRSRSHGIPIAGLVAIYENIGVERIRIVFSFPNL